ncbi:phenylalanine--tRNA ligase subunit beta [Coprococcus catus]|uniref:phenylalanine--tRNA ligase subunit beta n=1 Tax=Coprococcus catus TaxID=116085 RepID=UPI001C8B8366|nr:phenylalanine--tRNA ligase subunit beta [Coprococcus catus]MBX9231300.1 phenylalanine--tRNA ligase subunit beta [Coprococcus catus]MCT6799558.1 phenylalanine--tRNA ligase subunit beta [Coprococcus catus]
MRTSLKWIKDLVPGIEDLTPQEYLDAMTLSGSKGEYYVELDKNLENIVVGQILKIEKHPDADKLVICQVNVGQEEPVQIVTGAPNVFEGAVVPVVLAGGRVAGGHDGSTPPEEGIKIKKGKLRGVPSNGMMCSIEELGSSRDMYPDAPENGIYIFKNREDIKPGDNAVKALGLDDAVIEYEITSNRVDCFSILGIAREAAVTFDKPFCPPVVEPTGNDEDVNDFISVEVKDTELCPRYTARVVKNIKVGPSPEWMQRRLAAQGIRPINNIVDITNYVMEEYGQPMHAYDLSTIAGQKIIVRRAEDNEKFVTLDGQERTLDNSMLMICDAEKPVGIAGIMGGENSMITDDVDAILFEAACFDGTNIRLSGKKLGMRTDAQSKFEKGLDPNNASAAIDRACQLIEVLGCGEVVGGMVDVYGKVKEPHEIPFQPERINRLLGTDLSAEQMLGYFKSLELEYDADRNVMIIPTFRQDLLGTADLAEEVARFYGYSNIPSTLPSGESTSGKVSFKHRVEDVAKETAEFCGFSEGMTFSFESPKVFDKLRLDADDPLRQAITIANPQGEDYSIMKTTPLNGMLVSLARNFNRRNKDVKLYEMAKIYLPKSLPLTEYADERVQFTLGFYGEGDFFTMKGVVEEFLERAGMHDIVDYDPNAGKSFLHPGRQANIIYQGKVIGYMGEVHPEVCENYDLKTRAYIAVLDMPVITEMATFDRHFKGIAKHPAVNRDISMVVKKDILVGQIEKVIREKGGHHLESYHLFDIYEGSQIKPGYKSVAYSITFRANDRTLEEKDITAAMDKIIAGLEDLGIELRK